MILLVVGLLWMRGAAKKDRISTSGVAGTGQIMGLTQTGMLVNDQPQIELDLLVTIPGRSPYRAKVKEIVPLVMLNRLQGTLPVRVDPAEPETVVVQWDQPNLVIGAPAFDPYAGSGPGSASDETLGQVAAAMASTGTGAAPVFGQAAQAGYTVEQLRAYLRANGISGTARIDRLDDSGQTVGDERLFTMTTTVSIPGPADVHDGPVGGDGPAREGRPGGGRRGPAGQGRPRQREHGHVRVGPHLTSGTRRPPPIDRYPPIGPGGRKSRIGGHIEPPSARVYRSVQSGPWVSGPAEDRTTRASRATRVASAARRRRGPWSRTSSSRSRRPC